MAAAGDSRFTCESTKPMLTKRVYCSSVQVGDYVYVIGGCDQHGRPLDVFEGINLKKKKWEQLQSLMTKRAGSSVVALEGKIYVLSGVTTDQEPLDTVEVYDIKERKWSSLSNLKEKLLGVSAVVKDNKIYAVGGMTADKTARDYFACYQPDKDEWEELPPMPTPRYAATSLLIDNKLYVIGGRNNMDPVSSFEVFDFQESKWTSLDAIPSERVFALYTNTDTHIFSLGGLHKEARKGFSGVCEVFDIANGVWKIGAEMPTKRGDFAIGVIGGQVICAGGLGNQGQPLKTVEAYDESSDSWTALAEMPSSHCSCTYLSSNDKMYIAGGLSVGGASARFVILSMK